MDITDSATMRYRNVRTWSVEPGGSGVDAAASARRGRPGTHDVRSFDLHRGRELGHNLIVRDDLHPALQSLLLQAASEVHGRAGFFQRAGEFPAYKDRLLPLSPESIDRGGTEPSEEAPDSLD